MDDKTLQALTALAEKLGTTAEYLWGVLVRQAPITGAIDLAVMAAWVVTAVFVIRLVYRKTAKPAKTDENPYPVSEWGVEDETAFFARTCAGAFAFLIALGVSLKLSKVVAALLNPEYWALMQLLHK